MMFATQDFDALMVNEPGSSDDALSVRDAALMHSTLSWAIVVWLSL